MSARESYVVLFPSAISTVVLRFQCIHDSFSKYEHSFGFNVAILVLGESVWLYARPTSNLTLSLTNTDSYVDRRWYAKNTLFQKMKKLEAIVSPL